jgi:pimeloyl-ACP methyl ester carboxylesterase
MGLLALAAATVVALVIVRWIVRYYEPQLAFYPTKGEDATPAAYGVPFAPLTVTAADGPRIRVWHMSHANARAQVVYFHGNGGNLSMWAEILVPIARRGLDVIAFDYRGYGLSTGSPTEAGLYRDVDAVLALAHGRLRRAGVPIVYWGRSLGTTMAAYAATVQRPGGVILEAGFPSMRAVVRSNPVLAVASWFASYEFPTARYLAAAPVPALVLHGDADSVIPFQLGRELHEAIPGDKRFVTIKGGDHNDATPADPAAYWTAVDDFVARVR